MIDSYNTPITENSEEFKIISAIANQHQINHPKNNLIYKCGDSFKNLYLIISGSIKIYSINAQGDEQITSFHNKGHLIGFDAIAQNEHLSFAETLENTIVGEVPFSELNSLLSENPNLNLFFMKMLSAEITQKKNMLMITTKQSAEQRLAFFLLYTPFYVKTIPQTQFFIHLTMTREEIGKYLALSLETVSRALTNFSKQGIISVSGRSITIHSPSELFKIISTN
jgi:CRP/FNR family transcriptional regulator